SSGTWDRRAECKTHQTRELFAITRRNGRTWTEDVPTFRPRPRRYSGGDHRRGASCTLSDSPASAVASFTAAPRSIPSLACLVPFEPLLCDSVGSALVSHCAIGKQRIPGLVWPGTSAPVEPSRQATPASPRTPRCTAIPPLDGMLPKGVLPRLILPVQSWTRLWIASKLKGGSTGATLETSLVHQTFVSIAR